MSVHDALKGLNAIATVIEESNSNLSKIILEILERGIEIKPMSSDIKYGFTAKLRDK